MKRRLDGSNVSIAMFESDMLLTGKNRALTSSLMKRTCFQEIVSCTSISSVYCVILTSMKL